jgi:hypothetical protein
MWRKRRILRVWFTVTDVQVMKRVHRRVIAHRFDLKVFEGVMVRWRRLAVHERFRKAYIHDMVLERASMYMRLFLLLQGDFSHFAVTSSFHGWRRIIEMRHRLRSFVQWSFHHARAYAMLQYIFDLLRENANIIAQRINYLPFRQAGEKAFLIGKKSKMNQTRSLQKLQKARALGNDQFTFQFFGTIISNTVRSSKKPDRFQMENVTWAHHATRNQIRTLFYRLVVAVAHRGSIRWSSQTDDHEQRLNSFQNSHSFFTRADVVVYLRAQARADAQRHAQLMRWRSRNLHELCLLESHNAAVAFGGTIPGFTANADIGTPTLTVPPRSHMNWNQPYLRVSPPLRLKQG